MKKWFLVIIVLIVMVAGFFNVFCRNNSSEQTKTVHVNAKAFARTILEDETWRKWWPGKIQTSANNTIPAFQFNGNTYSIVEKRFSSLLINISNGKDSLKTELVFIPVKQDSVTLNWTGSNHQLKNDLRTILTSLEKFYASEENIYGLQIKKEHVVDSTLISTSMQTRNYPLMADAYKMIDKLKNYAEKNGAKQTGYPMLNIFTADNITYKTQVAIPTDKRLHDEGDIHFKWMLGGGNILVSEIKGGPYTANEAFRNMEQYIEDNGRVAPAIQFQSLITDRRLEPDSNKWITKLCWPVM